jgi:hypothetical protein
MKVMKNLKDSIEELHALHVLHGCFAFEVWDLSLMPVTLAVPTMVALDRRFDHTRIVGIHQRDVQRMTGVAERC